MPTAILRICLDVNVYVAYLMALKAKRDASAAFRVVETVMRMTDANGTPIQLSISLEMLDTLDRVLRRVGLPQELAHGFPEAVAELVLAGPEGREPGLPIIGREQFAMRDREDAGVLASCIMDRVNLLVTDNLGDFITLDAEQRETRLLTRQDGSRRKLYRLIHERPDEVAVVVAHPIDVADWLDHGFIPTPAAVRARYPASRPCRD